MADILRTHFFDNEEDARLDDRNIHFWRALAGHVQADGSFRPGGSILDVGCHRGGLLKLMAQRLEPAKLLGLEPLTSARQVAEQRLSHSGAEVVLLEGEHWSHIADESVDLALGHEVLQYIADPSTVLSQLHRVLSPGSFAYLALGCHTENPLWPQWKMDLEHMGHTVHDHSPLELMAAGAQAGFAPAVRPLRSSGWVHHDPTIGGSFTYPSVGTLLDHQFRHKLLFRFERRS